MCEEYISEDTIKRSPSFEDGEKYKLTVLTNLVPLSTEDKLNRCVDWIQTQKINGFPSENPDYNFDDNFDCYSKEPESDEENDSKNIVSQNVKRKGSEENANSYSFLTLIGIEKPQTGIVARRSRIIEGYIFECEWQNCDMVTSNYEDFQKHVKSHIPNLYIKKQPGKDSKYVCLWDICAFESGCPDEMIRHVNYHAYHGKLMAVGLSVRRNLKISRCNRDSAKRNNLPTLSSNFVCMWSDCDCVFVAIQEYFDHVNCHVASTMPAGLCSWAGCGRKLGRRLFEHIRSHTRERLVGCAHCGVHFASNTKLRDHTDRQKTSKEKKSMYICGACGRSWATARLLREHARLHVSTHACAHCDMTAPSPAGLATHMRYKHLGNDPSFRPFRCDRCQYGAVTKWDLAKHILTHDRKRDVTKEVVRRKRLYACHVCDPAEQHAFTLGSTLTRHLVRQHGLQWPYGHSRFRYQLSEDGMYRLTTTRYESLEISRQIIGGENGVHTTQRCDIDITKEYVVAKQTPATDSTPISFVLGLAEEGTRPSGELEIDNEDNNSESEDVCDKDNRLDVKSEFSITISEHEITPIFSDINNGNIEITIEDVDENGKIIKSKTVKAEKMEFS